MKEIYKVIGLLNDSPIKPESRKFATIYAFSKTEFLLSEQNAKYVDNASKKEWREAYREGLKLYNKSKISKSSLEEVNLNTHEFILELYNQQARIGKKIKKNVENIYDYVSKSNQFSKAEKFILKVSPLIQEINFKIDKLHMSCRFLEHYKNPRIPFTQGEYIEYHMEAYLVHSMGLLDRILKATNFLYGLGLGNKDLSLKNVLKRTEILNVHKSLAHFGKMLGDIRQSRNVVVHEYRYDTPGLNLATTREIVLMAQYAKNSPAWKLLFKPIQYDYNEIMQRLLITLAENDNTLIANYARLLDEFQIQYNIEVARS